MGSPLKNKKIIITGASSGIGEQIAIKAAEQGAQPILLARSIDKLQRISEGIKKNTGVISFVYKLDISNLLEVKSVFNQILEDVGEVDILINNAGFAVFDA